MKITNIKSFPVWGGNRNFFFVKVETDAGIYGIGEGGITWRELAAAACVDHLKPLLIGEDPRQIEHLWQLMFRGGFFPAGRIACSANAQWRASRFRALQSSPATTGAPMMVGVPCKSILYTC